MIVSKKARMATLVVKELMDRRDTISVYDTGYTLDKIIKDKMSISRFGDAEFGLILEKDLEYQEFIPEIRMRLLRVLKDKDHNDKCLVAIPSAISDLRGFTFRSSIFWMKYFAQYRKDIMPFLDMGYQYYDAQISRIYINRKDRSKAKEYFSMWREIWADKNVLIVEGSLSRFGVGNPLLDVAKSVRRIICPSSNAFELYKEIYDAVIQVKDADVVLISLGPTATILAYELSKVGLWAIDSGNLDMEYEWMLRKVKRQTAVHDKYTIEAKNGTRVDPCTDERYLSQIIKEIDR